LTFKAFLVEYSYRCVLPLSGTYRSVALLVRAGLQ